MSIRKIIFKTKILPVFLMFMCLSFGSGTSPVAQELEYGLGDYTP